MLLEIRTMKINTDGTMVRLVDGFTVLTIKGGFMNKMLS
jgi:hypothetical protein